MKLLIHVILWRDNTNHLEATNAQLRRFVKKRTQTTQLDISQLSEKYMGLQFRYNGPEIAACDSGQAASFAVGGGLTGGVERLNAGTVEVRGSGMFAL